MPGRNPHFTGRAGELDVIRAGLAAGTTMTVHAVHGLGGVGKTQTVIEYAHRNATTYDLVWWINAEQPALIASQLAALAGPLGLPPDSDLEVAVRAVCAALRRRRGWLLIFDNAEDVDHIRPVLPGGVGHVLITTRRSGFGYLGPVLDLDVLPRFEAITLLRRRAPELTEDQAHALAGLFGDLPLALEQTAAYLEQTQLPPAEYLDLLTTRAPDLYRRGRVVDHRYTIATLWSLSLERLRAAQPAAVQLLGLCAYLAPEPIRLELFTDHSQLLPAPLDRAVADPLTFAETVGAVLDYSLARRTETGLVLHRLVQAVIRQSGPAQPEHGPHPLAVVLSVLRADLPGKIYAAPQNWPRWQQLLTHVLAATAHHDDDAHPSTADAAAWLLDHAGAYQSNHGQLAAARPLLERALRIHEATDGPDHPHVASTLTHLGSVLRVLGELGIARALLERALRLHEAAYGPDHPQVAVDLNDLGWVLRNLGELATARPLFERALHIAETAYGPDHPASIRARQALQQPVDTSE